MCVKRLPFQYMSLCSPLALQLSLEGVVFSLMNESLSHTHKRKETQVMTTVETGGGCSNTNMCHRIGLMYDHAKVPTTTRIIIIIREKKIQSVFNLLLNKEVFDNCRRTCDVCYCSFHSICPLGIYAFDLLEHSFTV